MRHDFNIDHLHRILENCPEYEGNHHLDRPFMSASQIAIRFAGEHPNHDLVQTLPLGGGGLQFAMQHLFLTAEFGRHRPRPDKLAACGPGATWHASPP